ncbi:MAG: hypothetical protein JKY41_13305 [Rhodobacteraceae bacterium]|nr:hypothetical protein [Paracoccaceae bacterium]
MSGNKGSKTAAQTPFRDGSQAKLQILGGDITALYSAFPQYLEDLAALLTRVARLVLHMNAQKKGDLNVVRTAALILLSDRNPRQNQLMRVQEQSQILYHCGQLLIRK